MKKFQSTEAPDKKTYLKWSIIACMLLLNLSSYLFYENINPILFGILCGALISKAIDYFSSFNSKKYLTFEKENIIYGSDDCTCWHVCYKNISHIAHEKSAEFGSAKPGAPDRAFLHTLNNDKFLLHFSEDQLIAIKSEINKAKGALNMKRDL